MLIMTGKEYPISLRCDATSLRWGKAERNYPPESCRMRNVNLQLGANQLHTAILHTRCLAGDGRVSCKIEP